jgi:pimeloyl-ACP methyl ester carboxylesterase
MSPSPTAKPLYLGTGEERFLALFNDVPSPTERSAVLLCPPFGWEDICSYRSRRDWAEQLALAGHPTLRIDLPGSGDSAGGPTDPGRPAAWTQAVLDAGEWLRGASGAPGLAVIGIGLSGLLAARAALEGGQIDELVLWAAPARGRTLVRELRAFSRLEVANVVDPGEVQPPPEQGAEGELVANGYLLSADTLAALERLDLAELSRSAIPTRRVLLLGRDGLRADERLGDLFERAGASVTVAEGPGYGAMTVFAIVGAWLGKEEIAGTATAAHPQERAREQPGATSGEQPGAAPPSVQELELSCSGVRLRETAVFVDRPDGRLFGVLAEPVGNSTGLCAVLLNAGPQRHTGPNRMWVEIARRWAARGVPTLRIDLAGIGDSDGDATALVRVASLYVPAYVQQARAALDMLGARGLPERFLLLGLCAGAYWSMHAALQDERVTGIVMLNPRAMIWDEWVYTVRRTRDLRERLLLASTWRRILRRDITLARHLETARAIAGRALSTPLRARQRFAASRRADEQGPDPVEALFDALRDRDQRALLLLTGKEPLRMEFEASGLFDHLERWPNLELVLAGTSADTHTLTPLWLQREVHELVDRALESELERLPRR